MPEYAQQHRPLRIALGDLDPNAALITRFAGTEAVSKLFSFTLDLAAPVTDPLKFEDVLGKPASVQIDQHTLGQQTRTVHGLISRFSQGKRDDRFIHYRAELVPALWLLTRTTRSRIFQQKKVEEILTEVIGDLYPELRISLEDEYHPRNYCVQYRETDFAFVSRLMEEEGIYYYFTHGDKPGLVIADNPRGHDDLPAPTTLLFQDDGAALTDEGRVTRWDKSQVLRTGAAELTDHHFELTRTNDLRAVGFPLDTVKVGTVTHKMGVGAADATAFVDHPGGYAHWRDGVAPGGGDRAADLDPTFEDNTRIASVRMDQEQTRAIRIDADSTYCRTTPGHKFTLADHYDADGEYVLTSVHHDAVCGIADTGASHDFRYANEFECLPFDLPFRPLRETPRPFIRGTQTGVVVGSDGEEIDPDKYGRVKVWFRWDPEGERNLDTSCWVRVAQPWAGQHWGTQFIPRVGDEVVVTFLEGDPDRPLIVGSVYNADNVPIYKLPQNKTQTGIKTHSSKTGTTENYNEIRFEDKKGHEQVLIHAEKDMSVTVEDNYTVSIGAAQKDPKKAGKSSSTTFGDTSYTVTKGDYKFSVDAGKADYFVKGPVTEVYDNTQSTTATAGIDVVSKTSHIHLTAPTEIVLTVGGSQITIKPDSITLKSANIHFEGGANLTGKAPHVGLEGTTDLTATAPEVTIDGKSGAGYFGGTVDVIARSVMTAGVGGQTVMCNDSKVAVSGAAITSKADGTHEVVGALVKIN
jgi:type VI secretion system secreted protein VgrG